MGKTALAATLGIESDFPFVKVVSADNMVGYSESAKVNAIVKVFEDAYKVSICNQCRVQAAVTCSKLQSEA